MGGWSKSDRIKLYQIATKNIKDQDKHLFKYLVDYTKNAPNSFIVFEKD